MIATKNNRRLYTIENIKKIFKEKGYVFFPTDKMYNLNLIGVRSFNPKANSFDDTLIVIFSDETGQVYNWQYDITTDPGAYWLKHPLNKNGTAILVPSQYRDVWKIRLHQGKYEALCQKSNVPVKVYRDRNRDDILDFDTTSIDDGIFGINLHHSNYYTESYQVDKWSAGCQVFKRVKDFNEVMKLAKKARKLYGNSFTYTLLEEKDFLLNY